MKVLDVDTALLKNYVYVYSDPRSGEPFYIGKGQGNRVLFHLDDPSDSEKCLRIAEIRAAGLEPKIDFLRYGLSEDQASLVEAAAIDLIGRNKLTNVVAGHHTRSFGKVSASDLLFDAPSVKVRHKAVLITINQLFRSGMSPQELYEVTRGIWVLDPRRASGAEVVMAVYQGVVREVYRPVEWHPAGTTQYLTRETEGFLGSGRWEFVGPIAEDIRNEYVRKSVGRGTQNPIRYANA